MNSGDRDATTALALELDVALEKPFSPVGGEAFIEAEKQASASAAIVVCGVTFGPGNVVNLELAERMQGQGIPVFLMAGIESRDYTPEGKAGAIAARLREGGAKEWESIADLLRLLPGMGECPDEGGAV